MSLDITDGFPTVDANTTALSATGGTSGIIVDNESSLAEAPSIYYATKTGATLVKSTQPALNARKRTQVATGSLRRALLHTRAPLTKSLTLSPAWCREESQPKQLSRIQLARWGSPQVRGNGFRDIRDYQGGISYKEA